MVVRIDNAGGTWSGFHEKPKQAELQFSDCSRQAKLDTFLSNKPVENGQKGEFLERGMWLHKGKPPAADQIVPSEDQPWDKMYVDYVNPNHKTMYGSRRHNYEFDSLPQGALRPSIADMKIDFNLKVAQVSLRMNNGRMHHATMSLEDAVKWIEGRNVENKIRS